MTARARQPTQAEIARALRAAREAGVDIERFEVEGARVVVYARGGAPVARDPVEAWLAANG